MPRELVIELLDQCRPEQRFVVFVELAVVQSIDEIDRRRIWISDREIPSLVANLDTKCSAIISELAITPVFNSFILKSLRLLLRCFTPRTLRVRASVSVSLLELFPSAHRANVRDAVDRQYPIEMVYLVLQ